MWQLLKLLKLVGLAGLVVVSVVYMSQRYLRFGFNARFFRFLKLRCMDDLLLYESMIASLL